MSNDDLLLNLPPREIDLSQAQSLDFGRAETGRADEHILKFKRVLEDVMHELTSATQTALERQTEHFNGRLKVLMDTVQEALNDIDERLSLLSREQGRTEEVLDALIKLWLLGNTYNTDDQKKIIEAFLARGQQPQPTDGEQVLTTLEHVLDRTKPQGTANAAVV